MDRSAYVRLRLGAAVLGLAISQAPSLAPAWAQEKDIDLVVVVHPENRAVPPSEIEQIFLLKRRQWPDGTPIVPFNHAARDANRTAFDRAVLRMSPDEAARYWLDQRIRSGIRAPRQIGDASLLVRLVGRLKGAVAYVPANAVNGSVRVIARIRGGKLLPP
jgi:hypothetical protein